MPSRRSGPHHRRRAPCCPRANGLARFDNRYRHKDGSYRWISWVGAAGRRSDRRGRPRHHRRKAREAELWRPPRRRLRQSQKMEAVGQLTGGLAHDFNNLLAGISGTLELMQTRMAQGRLDGCRPLHRRPPRAPSKRAAALTHRLLAFSRRQTLDPKPTDVNRLVAGMEDLIRRTVGPDDHVGGGRRGGPVAGAGRPAPARERAAQPVHQRPRRDAGRRPHHHRDRQQVAGRARRPRARPAAGPVPLAVRDRHRHRHDAGGHRAGVRAVLHHQADRARAPASACR